MSEDNSANCITCVVPAPLVNQIWHKVEPIIDRVVKRVPDDVDSEILRRKIISGSLMLVVILQDDEIIGVNVLDVVTLDTGTRVLVVQITAGILLDLWIDHTLEMFKGIAKSYNCTGLRCIGVRDGWVRKLKPHGWNQLFVTMQCDIETEKE